MMDLDVLVGLIVILIFMSNCSCYEHLEDDSIFLFGQVTSYCEMKCNGTDKHTLCGEGGLAKKCPKKTIIYDYNKRRSFREDIVSGLNGLRQRIAEKMHVANMNQLNWDVELGLMAKRYLEQCQPRKRNLCTDMGEGKQDEEPPYYHVSGAMGYKKDEFLEYQVVAEVLRDWYYEKNISPRPVVSKTFFGAREGTLEFDNNFSRLAAPHVSRVGCSVAQYNEDFAVLCYFFPFFKTPVKYREGPPASECLEMNPLRGHFFPSLCTARANSRLTGSLKCYLFEMVLLLAFWQRNTYGYRMFRLRV